MNMSLISVVTELWIDIKDTMNDTKHDYKCTSSMMGHPMFQLACNKETEQTDLQLVDWQWLSSEFVTRVTIRHFPYISMYGVS
jgi:hypothetical protein